MKSKINGSPPLTGKMEARNRGPCKGGGGSAGVGVDMGMGIGLGVSARVRRMTCSILAAVMLSSAITSPYLNSHTVGDHYEEPKGMFERLLDVRAAEGSSVDPASEELPISKMPEEGNSIISTGALKGITGYTSDAVVGAVAGAITAIQNPDGTWDVPSINNVKESQYGENSNHTPKGEAGDFALGQIGNTGLYEARAWYKLGSNNDVCFGATTQAKRSAAAFGGVPAPEDMKWWGSGPDEPFGVGGPKDIDASDIKNFDVFGEWSPSKYSAFQKQEVFEMYMFDYMQIDDGALDTYTVFKDLQSDPSKVEKNIDELYAYLASLRPIIPWKPMNSNGVGRQPCQIMNRESIYALALGRPDNYGYAWENLSNGLHVDREYNEEAWRKVGRNSGCNEHWSLATGYKGTPRYNHAIYFPIYVELQFCGVTQSKEDGTDPPNFPDDGTEGGTGTPGTPTDPPWTPGDPDPPPYNPPPTPTDSPTPDPSTSEPPEPSDWTEEPSGDPESSGSSKESGEGHPTGSPGSGDEDGEASPGSEDEGTNEGENKSSDEGNKGEGGEHESGTSSEGTKTESGEWKPAVDSKPDPWESGRVSEKPDPDGKNSGEVDERPDKGDGTNKGEGVFVPPSEEDPTIDIPGGIVWPYTVCNCGGPCPGDGAERGVTCTEAGGQKCECGNPKHTEKKGCNSSCGGKCDGSKDKCACPCDATIEWEPNEPTSKTPYKKLTIEGKVLVANFIEDWDKRRPQDGNVFATGFEDIQDIEKHEDVPGCFAHSGSEGKGTKHPICHTDQCGTDENPHPCAVEADTFQQNYCHSIYTFRWTPNPQTQLDEKELKMVPNMMYVTAPFTGDEGAMIANKYVMTRKGDYPDIEFTNKGRVFDIYTFYNTNSWGNNKEVKVHTHEGPDGEGRNGGRIGPKWIDRYLEDYTLQLKPKNPTKAEPFRDPFQVSFLSHRFAKYMTENLEEEVGESKILPLAGYMEPTSTNKDYKTWSEPREIYRRVKWYLDEQDQTNLDGMHKGTKPEGFNIRWGHGGDWGTVTGNDPMDPEGSDQIWNNDFSWSRQILGVYPEWDPSHFKWCEVEECDIHSEHEEKPENCPHHNTSNQFTAIADQLNSPRAEFLRTLVIQDTVYGEAKTCEADGFEYYARENEYKNDRITWHIPSTKFNFSPTYKMYGDYGPDMNPEDYHDIWMLASDADTVQFNDVVDLNITGGDVVVRSNWSRDFEDTNVKDPNRGTIINVLKAGNAYWIDTTDFKLEITAVVHYWDTNFWEPGSAQYVSAVNDNAILREYEESLNNLMAEIDDNSFAYYTNLIGGTSSIDPKSTSRLRLVPQINPKIFNNEPVGYVKLCLSPSEGFAKQYKSIYSMNTSSDNRLDGGWDTWDSTWAQSDGAAKWSEGTYQAKVPDDAIHSEENLKSVLLTQDWYVEDYEAIKVKVFEGSVEIKQLKSNPAQVWERLSDSMTDTNKWSPEMRHYLAERGPGEEPYVTAGRVLIPEGSVGAGTEFLIPTFRVFPDGIKGGGADVHDFSMMLYPDVFGVRGSTFDN